MKLELLIYWWDLKREFSRSSTCTTCTTLTPESGYLEYFLLDNTIVSRKSNECHTQSCYHEIEWQELLAQHAAYNYISLTPHIFSVMFEIITENIIRVLRNKFNFMNYKQINDTFLILWDVFFSRSLTSIQWICFNICKNFFTRKKVSKHLITLSSIERPYSFSRAAHIIVDLLRPCDSFLQPQRPFLNPSHPTLFIEWWLFFDPLMSKLLAERKIWSSSYQKWSSWFPWPTLSYLSRRISD
jgi:hypothetical protein